MRNGNKAPAWARKAFRPDLVAIVKRGLAEQAADPHCVPHNLREAEAALDWLDGARVGPDCKIEIRRTPTGWKASLMVGICGMTAVNALLVADDV